MSRNQFWRRSARLTNCRRNHVLNQSSRSKPGQLGLEPLEQRLALTTLPAGFSETLITTNSNLSSPTAMDFDPTCGLWVLEQAGDVEYIRTDGSAHTALDLVVDSSGERGLLGIAIDPNYDGAGPNADYVYLYYTEPRQSSTNPANNQVVRYTVADAGTTTPTLTGAQMIREFPPEDEDNDPTTDGNTNHNGGAIHFGPDGKLYVAIGDHNYDPPGNQQDTHPSQRLDTPFGKILRLNPDGTNPTDNPFYTASTSNWEGSIWAMGLRNPYTFAIDPANGRLFINDVGEGSWEEINDGQAAANYGWAGSNSPVWEGFEDDGTPPPWTNYQDPIMAYNHSSDLPTPAGVDITGGAFYPANSQFGSDYAGKYFFADAGANFIRVFDPANPGSLATPDTSTNFASNMTTFGPVDLKIDADGNLFYLARGGEVYRISFTGNYGPASIAARHLFYNGSGFDGGDVGVNGADDGAIATDKVAYLPGAGVAVTENVSNYSRGINGIMIDIAGNHGPLALDDFSFRMGNNNAPETWDAAPTPVELVVRAGAGEAGSDRVEIVWANGAIRNTWLEVIVKGNDATGGFNTDTGLGSSDVFYWGNKVGDSGSSPSPGTFDTTTTDSIQVFATLGAGRPITDPRDYNHDGQVTTTDSLIVFSNLGTLNRLNLPPATPLTAAAEQDSAPERSAIASAISMGSTGSVVATEAFSPWLESVTSEVRLAASVPIIPSIARRHENRQTVAVSQSAIADTLLDDELLAQLLGELPGLGH